MPYQRLQNKTSLENHTWLPASQPDTQPLFTVTRAFGSHLYISKESNDFSVTGAIKEQKIYDAISSWWCKPLGHNHPLVINSLTQQLGILEHHIPANLHNETIENLSAKLLKPFKYMDKVMYACDGSSAVEIAMKLSYEYRVLTGQIKKSQFIALTNAYHGETIFTLSVCGIDAYKRNYAPFLYPHNHFILDIPYVNSRHDPLWQECGVNQQGLEEYIATIAPQVTALIIEPVVQGAAGLKIISRDFLIKLIHLARAYNMHIISDEIMVGLGRLGYISIALEMLDFEADLVCVAKNLTAGSVPMSAVIINQKISNIFRLQQKVFPHSHTHSCNTLAARVANSYLDLLYTTPTFLETILLTEPKLYQMFINLAQQFPFITNVRAIGAIAACDLNLNHKIIEQIFLSGIHHGIYLRPIGNTLYIMPPLYNLANDLNEIEEKLHKVLVTIRLML